MGIFLQSLIAVFGAGRIRGATLTDVFNRTIELLRSYCAGVEGLLRFGFHHAERHQNTLYGHKTVACLLRQFFRLGQNLASGAVNIDLRITCDLGNFGQSQIQMFADARRNATGSCDQIARQPLFVVQKRFEQMLRPQAGVIFSLCDGLGRLNKTARPFGEFI